MKTRILVIAFLCSLICAFSLAAEKTKRIYKYLDLKEKIDSQSLPHLIDYFFKQANHDEKRYMRRMFLAYFAKHPNEFINLSSKNKKFYNHLRGSFFKTCNYSNLTDQFSIELDKKLLSKFFIELDKAKFANIYQLRSIYTAGCRPTLNSIHKSQKQYPESSINNLNFQQQIYYKLYKKYFESINKNVALLNELGQIRDSDSNNWKIHLFSYCKEKINTDGLVSRKVFVQNIRNLYRSLPCFKSYNPDAIKLFLADFQLKFKNCKNKIQLPHKGVKCIKTLFSRVSQKGARFDFLSENFIKNIIVFSTCEKEKGWYRKAKFRTGLNWKSEVDNDNCGIMSSQAVIMDNNDKIRYILSFNNAPWPKLLTYRSLSPRNYIARELLFYIAKVIYKNNTAVDIVSTQVLMDHKMKEIIDSNLKYDLNMNFSELSNKLAYGLTDGGIWGITSSYNLKNFGFPVTARKRFSFYDFPLTINTNKQTD